MFKLFLVAGLLLSICLAQKFEYKEVSASGSRAKCPDGFKVISCACGNKNGSYNFEGVDTCFCQLPNQDWTRATCAKMLDSQLNYVNFEVSSEQSSGSYQSCPADFTAVSCSCGGYCGEWQIVQNKCNCHCGDWTRANCVKPDSSLKIVCQETYANAQTSQCANPKQTVTSCSCGNLACNSWNFQDYNGQKHNQCYCHPGCGSTWSSGTCCSLIESNTCSTLYSECDYQGQSYLLCANDPTLGSYNYAVKSIKVPNGMKVTLYSEESYAGGKQVFVSDNACIDQTKFA